MKKNRAGNESTEKVIAEIPLSGTKQIRIALSTYKGEKYLAMRSQYKDDAEDEEWKFGRGGLNLPVKRLTPESCKQFAGIFKKVAEKLEEKAD